MDYHCDRILTILEATKGCLRPSEPPQLTIKLDFFFRTEYLVGFIPNQDSTALEWRGYVPVSSDSSSAMLAFGDSLSFDEVAEAVKGAAADLIPEDKLQALIGLACDVVRVEFPSAETLAPPKHKILEIRFDVVCAHVHVYGAEADIDDGGPRMVPAAEASVALLEEYEMGGGEEEERCCCICLDEFLGDGGGVVLRMPCLHLFHGGCIKEWLKSSHYCPLCRYEMPTK